MSSIMIRRLGAAVLLFAFLPAGADGQSMRDRLKAKVKERAEQRVEAAMDRAVDAIPCLSTDRACVQKADAEGRKVVLTDEDGNPLSEEEGAAARQAMGMPVPQTPGAGAWANFDFVPGEKVLFADDFAREQVGNFPQRLEFHGGTMEVVESDGRRWLRVSSEGLFAVALPEALPARFTAEFDVAFADYANGEIYVFTQPLGEAELAALAEGGSGVGSLVNRGFLRVAHAVELLDNQSGNERRLGGVDGAIEDEMAHRIRIHVDGRYVKVYVDEKRVINVPAAEFPRADKLYFALVVHPEYPPLLGDIRVNAGGRRMYDALLADGRVATQGIYFDTGSDRIRAESSGTLKEIADMLAAHRDLRLLIEGHTDNVGAAASNQTLSEQRAAAVKSALVSRYGVAADRLQTAGLGDTRPAAPNATPEGRQNNRRVELVKL